MTHTGVYTYVSSATDRIGRHREIAELMNDLYDAHGPGNWRQERVPDPNPTGPRSEMPNPEFSNSIRWFWTTRA